MIDDVLIFGKNQEEHDEHLSVVLGKILRTGMTLNKRKCQFSKNISGPNKVSAIRNPGKCMRYSSFSRNVQLVKQICT